MASYLFICFRRINHAVVKNHLHSSSDVQEVVSSTTTRACWFKCDHYNGFWGWAAFAKLLPWLLILEGNSRSKRQQVLVFAFLFMLFLLFLGLCNIFYMNMYLGLKTRQRLESLFAKHTPCWYRHVSFLEYNLFWSLGNPNTLKGWKHIKYDSTDSVFRMRKKSLGNGGDKATQDYSTCQKNISTREQFAG
jgi:hypothetical protein